MQISRKVVMIGAAFVAFAASPALAQSEGGIEGPPEDTQFYTPQNVDTGIGCSRTRPKECTPEERESYNELVMALCTISGGTLGYVSGALAGWAVAGSIIGAPAAPVATTLTTITVTTAAVTSCYSTFKIPAV